MTEKWAQIEGYEGFYEVSDLGNIRSMDRLVAFNRNGKSMPLKRQSIPIRQTRNAKGYQEVILSREGARKTIRVHRLVAAAFCPAGEGDQVNHLNSVRHDNRAENLEWCTGKENVAHAMDNHPDKWGRKAVCAMKDDQVLFTFESAREAGRHGFHSGNISSALSGRLKTHRGYQWVLRSDLEALGVF